MYENVNMFTWEEAVLWLKKQPGNEVLVKACYYDDPIDSAAERFYKSDEWQSISALLKSIIPCKVLDVGAGRGISSFAFAMDGYQVTAIEPDNSDIVGSGAIKKLFKIRELPVTIIQEFGEKLPLENESFDIVYGRAVMHHAKNLNKFCSEAFRVLKKGGHLLMTREHVISKREDLQTFFDTHDLHKLYGGENAFLLIEYRDALLSAGFKIKKILAPMYSPINYAPQTKQHFEQAIRNMIIKKTGSMLVSSNLLFHLMKNIFMYYNTIKSNTPGRLYSFYATK